MVYEKLSVLTNKGNNKQKKQTSRVMIEQIHIFILISSSYLQIINNKCYIFLQVFSRMLFTSFLHRQI